MSRHKAEPVILDGGMSRELIRLGAPFRQPEWSAVSLIEAPHFVQQVHRDFINAGADIITTNSYALVPFHIGEQLFRERGQELAALAGRLARDAADEAAQRGQRVLVAGSLPPIFGSYEPGNFVATRVHEYLDVLVRGLEPYVDLWLGETLSLIAEATAVVNASQYTRKPLWIAFTPDDSETSTTTSPNLRSGESIEEVAHWALSAKVDALLFNCCRPEYLDSVIDTTKTTFDSENSATELTSLPTIGVYANAFLPRSNEYSANTDISPTDDQLTADAYARFASRWAESGAGIVGGCCGVGHEHIQQLARELKPSAPE